MDMQGIGFVSFALLMRMPTSACMDCLDEHISDYKVPFNVSFPVGKKREG